MDSEPKTYQVSPEGVERLAWRRAVWVFVFFVLFTVLLVVAFGQSADQDQRQRLVVGGWIVIVTALIASFFALKKRRRYWASYRLRFGEDSILRLQEGLEPMRLYRGEITKVEEVRGAGLSLRTNARLRLLFIPVDLAGFEEVRDIISRWQTPQTLTFLTRASRTGLVVGFVLLYLALWLICARSENVAVLVPSALLLYGLLALGLWDHQRNPNLTKHQKVIIWVLLLAQWKFFALPYLRMCSVFAR
jgi:hypothetical protein